MMTANSQLKSDFLEGCFRIPHDAPPRWLLMLTAYVDETGQEQDDWMFIAGYYGNDAAWKQVAHEWPKAIGPQRQYLHMSSLRFQRESERLMLERAGKVPRDCGLVPMLGGVRRSDYADLFRSDATRQMMNGYVVCIWAMLFDTLHMLPDGERLEIVFERQDRFSDFAEAAILGFVKNPPPEVLLADGRPKLASWRWVPKGSTSLMEPADYLCFALSKYHREYGSVKQKWSHPIMRNQEGQGFGRIMQRDDVRRAFERTAASETAEERQKNEERLRWLYEKRNRK